MPGAQKIVDEKKGEWLCVSKDLIGERDRPVYPNILQGFLKYGDMCKNQKTKSDSWMGIDEEEP